ncbi:MAG: DUF2971 domain-containing protein [Sulfuriferula sp.]
MFSKTTIITLRKLSLRAMVACALRCATRIQPLIKPSPTGLTSPETLSAVRLNNIMLLLCQGFCREGFNPNSRIAEVAEENKWKEQTKTPLEADAALASGGAVFMAATEAAFGNVAMPGVASSSTAEKVRQHAITSIELAFKALLTSVNSSAFTLMQAAVEHDIDVLKSLNLGAYPELGELVESMDNGPLGLLWPLGIPEGLQAATDACLAESRAIPTTETRVGDEETVALAIQSFESSDVSDLGLTISSPNHPLHLCRYMRASRFIEALSDSKFYCAKLSSFNDPFDGQLLPNIKFGKNEVAVAFREQLTRLLQSGTQITERQDMLPFEKIVFEYQQGAFKEISPGEFIDITVALLLSSNINFGPTNQDRVFIQGLADIIRMLCLSKEHDNLLLWAHYTEEHTGGVIQLRLDSSSPYLALAQPVEYSRDLPPSATPSDYATYLLGEPSSAEGLMKRQILVKSYGWGYEREWRIPMKKDLMDDNGCTTIRPEDIDAIYLGCRMKVENKRTILDLVESRYKNVTVYQAIKDENEFRLNFIPIRIPFNATAETVDEQRVRMSQLYRNCLDMYFQFWNRHLGATETTFIESLQLDCMLGQHATPKIQCTYRLMMDELVETYSKAVPLPVEHDLTPENIASIKNKTLRPSAILFEELRVLADTELRKLGGSLPFDTL